MRWLLVDKILEIDPGKKALGVRCFSRSELFFMDHFPGYPIVPGVLQIEMIAQVGGKCIMAANPGYLPVLTSVKSAQFRRAIEPGDSALIHAEVTLRKSYSLANGWIEVDGKKVSSAEVMYGLVPIPETKPKFGLEYGTITGEGI
ncbi:3-hydroxyacyl-ACP dehydratase FabZ family protein [Prosthecochloris sp. SCSIO W1103]|uniref:3-hydroxyacyl-ACP dehydratase FabZ family protein n=1 Tax=Prosthecochloris sp. SCSIO W1103 TaxID=2992244 RepID=UPI00223CD46D|nr:3-hydroxyacyl-ACP dehydratase FabZ family protein [Prosthecochloris sp. SCSIO W1103]UZJ37480.1 beta-hydroxyacyl-ACP dehydratase [Prosthecochloris sp. SCSIO W1103]